MNSDNTHLHAPLIYKGYARLRLNEKLAATVFFVVLAGHIFYQLLIQVGIISPVLGGYFTASCLVTFPILIVALSYSKVKAPGITEWLFLSFLFIFLIRVIVGTSQGASTEITAPHLAYLLKFLSLFLLAALTPWGMVRFQRACRFTILGITVFMLAVSAKSACCGDATSIHDSMEEDYQGMAFAFIVIAVGALSGAKKRLRLCIYAASITSLFMIGARAEFAGFFFLAFIIEYLLATSKLRFAVDLAGVLIVLLLAGLYFYNASESNRIFNLLDVGSDPSVIERKFLNEDAIATISSFPIFGNYASYSPGHYAHNILSAWVDLGLPGILALSLTLCFPLTDLMYRKRIYAKTLHNHPTITASIAMLATCCLLLVLAKAYTYQLIPIALGFYLYTRSNLQIAPKGHRLNENSLH